MNEVESLIEQCARASADAQAAPRVRRHLLSALACLGKHTMTRHIATAGRHFVDWSADYRLYSKERVKTDLLFAPVRERVLGALKPGQPIVVAMDDTRLKKSSRKTPGVKYVRDPLGPPFHVNLILAQRFIQTSMAWPGEEGQARMVPIDFTHAPGVKKPKMNAEESVWKAYRQSCREHALPRVGQQCLRELRHALDQNNQAKTRPLVCVVDGGYTNGTFLKNLPERTAVIGRIRGDAKLFHLPQEQNERGRPRVYGAPAPTPEQLRQDQSVRWKYIEAYACGKRHRFAIKTLAPLRWRATGKEHDLRLVVIRPLGYRLCKGGKVLYRKPAYLICTDLKATLENIVQHYLWRWDIEVNFRDEKSLLGVGQAQVHHPESVHKVPALSVAAYAILLAASLSLYGAGEYERRLAAPKWQRSTSRRATTQTLINELRQDLWGQAINSSHLEARYVHNTKSDKSRPPLASALLYGASCA